MAAFLTTLVFLIPDFFIGLLALLGQILGMFMGGA